MSRLAFAALASLILSSAAAAQQVPGRDLLDFPLGLVAEPAALSTQMPGGFWNPATSAMDQHGRGQFGFAGLTTPQDQGVHLEMAAASYRVRPTIVASASIVQASVADILETATDPQTIGNDIPYETTVASTTIAAQRGPLDVGIAARYRWGVSDTRRTGAMNVDAGAVLDGIAGIPIRLAASSYLYSPAANADPAAYFLAADVPLYRRDSTLALRGGYSYEHTAPRARETYTFAMLRYTDIDLNAGLARSRAYTSLDGRWRLGVGLHYAAYTVGIGREDGAAGFGPNYQFLLTRVIP